MIIQRLKSWLKKLINSANTSAPEDSPHTTTEYPACILPTSGHVSELHISKICDVHQGCAIVRRSIFTTESQTFNELGAAEEDAIIDSYDALTNMSCNLLGGEFVCDHIRWRQTGMAKAIWDKVTRTVADFDPANLHNESDSIGILIPLKELYQIKVPFTKRTKDKGQRKSLELKQPVETFKETVVENGKRSEETTFKFNPGIIVEHSPSNSNYWHVELSLTENANGEVVKMKNFRPFDEKIADMENQHHTTLAAMHFMQNLTIITKKQSDFTSETIGREIYMA